MISIAPSAIRLKVRVQPRASRNRVLGAHGDALKVQVSAPPVDGAANQAVISLIAEWLSVPPRSVRIVQGQSGRDKLVEVASDEPAALAGRVRSLLDGCVDKAGGHH